MLESIILAIVGFYQALVSMVESTVRGLVNQISIWFGQIYAWLENILPEEALEIFESLSNFWFEVQPIIEFMTYFVPFWGIMFIVMSTYYAVAMIRIVRWLLGIIPTLNLG